MPSETSHQEAISSQKQFVPINQYERVSLLDVLRGFAVLGILLVNQDIGKHLTEALFPSAVDRFGHTLIYVLGYNKFWPLFALLFGVGFAVQLERAQTQNKNIIPTYLRRLFFMSVIGFLLQLVIYVPQLLWLSIAGVPMLFIGYVLRHSRPRWILAATVIAFMFDMGMSIPNNFARDPNMVGPPDVSLEEAVARIEEYRGEIEGNVDQSVSWSLESLEMNIQQQLRFCVKMPSLFWRSRGSHARGLVGFMLLGIFIWRVGVVQNIARHRLLLIRLFGVALPISLAAAIYTNKVDHSWAMTWLGLGEYPTSMTRLILTPLHTVGSLGMVLTYSSGIALLMQSAFWARVLKVLGPVGQMALTNYALQSLLPILLFGFYTPGIPKIRLGVWLSIVVLLLLFGLQVVFSTNWIRSYRFGPLEWLLRSLTYWKIQPISRTVTTLTQE